MKYKATLTSYDGRDWTGYFDTLDQVNTWLQRQVVKEGRKPARWIFYTEASDIELSREDDRREFLQGGVSGYEIHVPNDFVSGIEDITDALALQKEEEDEFQRRMDGQRILSYLGVLINRANYDSATLATIEAMPYVAETKSALMDGGFEYALYYASNVTPNESSLTQTMIDGVIARIQAAMAKYPDLYNVSGV